MLAKYEKMEKRRQEFASVRDEEVTNKRVRGEIREGRLRETLAEQGKSELRQKREFYSSLESSLEKVVLSPPRAEAFLRSCRTSRPT